MRAYHRAAVAGLAVFAIACKGVEPTQPVPPGPPAQMIRVSGDFQSALAGHELASPIRVRVLDSAGIPVPRQAVNFKVVSGGGSVFAGVALTTDSGYAAERWTLGTSTQEPQRLEARAVNQNTGEALVFATFSATVLPEAAATLAAISGDAQTGTVATALPEPAAVIVKDQYGNPVPGVTVTWLAANGGSVTPATSQTAANGVATTQWTLGTVAGTQGASASAAGIGGGAVGFSAVASPGPLATLTFTQAGPLNLIVKDVAQLQVRAADAYGNSVTPPSVTWSSSTPTVVTAQCTGSSNCEFGQVTAVGPGTAQVTASSGGKSASLTVNAAYGTPSSITVSTTLHYYDSFNPFPWIQQGETGQMSATIKDDRGNVLPGTVTWTSSNPSLVGVSSDGVVTAVAPAPAFGTQVVITATSGSLSNSITIKEANYTIYPYPIQLAVGDSAIVHVSGCAYGSGVRPSFASSSPTVATVTGFSSGAAPDSATIKAIGVGQTTIHATCYVGLTGDRFPSVSVYLYVTVVSASAQAAQEPTPTVVAAIPLLSFLHESRDSDRRLLMH